MTMVSLLSVRRRREPKNDMALEYASAEGASDFFQAFNKNSK